MTVQELKNRFASIYFGKSSFYLPTFEISRSCRTASAKSVRTLAHAMRMVTTQAFVD